MKGFGGSIGITFFSAPSKQAAFRQRRPLQVMQFLKLNALAGGSASCYSAAYVADVVTPVDKVRPAPVGCCVERP